MADRLADLVDGERLLVRYFKTAVLPACGTDVPADLTDPFLQVVRTGGGERAPGLDLAAFDLDLFAPTRGQAWALAKTAHRAARQLRGQMLAAADDEPAAATITGVRTLEEFRWAPWDNTNVRRLTATYEFGIKSRLFTTV